MKKHTTQVETHPGVLAHLVLSVPAHPRQLFYKVFWLESKMSSLQWIYSLTPSAFGTLETGILRTRYSLTPLIPQFYTVNTFYPSWHSLKRVAILKRFYRREPTNQLDSDIWSLVFVGRRVKRVSVGDENWNNVTSEKDTETSTWVYLKSNKSRRQSYLMMI